VLRKLADPGERNYQEWAGYALHTVHVLGFCNTWDSVAMHYRHQFELCKNNFGLDGLLPITRGTENESVAGTDNHEVREFGSPSGTGSHGERAIESAADAGNHGVEIEILVHAIDRGMEIGLVVHDVNCLDLDEDPNDKGGTRFWAEQGGPAYWGVLEFEALLWGAWIIPCL
jgi:hypothetical protein